MDNQCEMIEQLDRILNRISRSEEIISLLESKINNINSKIEDIERRRLVGGI